MSDTLPRPRLSIEQKQVLRTPEQKTSRIAELVAKRPEIAGLQSYEYLSNEGKKHFDDFISGADEHLRLEYKDLSREKLESLARGMEEAMASLLVGEQNDQSRALFNALEYRLSELFLLMMAADMNAHRDVETWQQTLDSDPDAEKKRQEAIDWYRQANETVYGHPDPALFAALAKRDIVAAPAGDHFQAVVLHSEMQPQLGTLPDTDREVYKPSEALKERIEGLVRERFADLVSHIDKNKKYSREEAKAALQEALGKIDGARELGWELVDKPGSALLAISAHQKRVEFGTERDTMDGEELTQKTIHELGVHVTRSVKAMKVGWLSAAYGQEGYLDFEESLANILSEAYIGEYKNDGSKFYLAIGLALGQDGHPPRDDREVYEIMWRRLAIKEAKNGADVTPANIEEGKKMAALLCMRIYRATPGDEPGVVYSKDLSYFRGQQKVWQILENVHTVEDLDDLLLGKLDPTDPAHLEILKAIKAALAEQ